MPPGTTGNSLCGAYASYALFNNGGSGFTPDPGTTQGVVQVQAVGAYIPNTDFNLLWRASALDRGCAAPVAGSATEKSFAISPTKKYTLTLYFKPGHCPSRGTDVALEVSFI